MTWYEDGGHGWVRLVEAAAANKMECAHRQILQVTLSFEYSAAVKLTNTNTNRGTITNTNKTSCEYQQISHFTLYIIVPYHQ